MLDKTDHNRVAEQTNGRLAIGGNNPPGPIESAKEAMQELSAFTENNPVIENFDGAKQYAAWIERTRVALQAVEDQRKPLVDPLNAELERINKPYRLVRQPLEKLYELAKSRLTKFNNAVEAARLKEAQRLREKAERQEREAREAEAREQEAIHNAEQGELTDAGGAIVEADQAFKGFQKADRAAATAERNVPVRIASVMGGKSLSMRTTEVFTVEDACAAITIMGCSDDLKKQIIKDAKRFREATGELPDGVKSEYQRSL
jgi:NAD-specific glutamate dehydrogenase